jgi:hypothetical protein
MKVVDGERSERGRQRRKTADGRLLHCCCICGALAPWDASWTTYCSLREIDDELPIPKFCSEACRAVGGSVARNVTAEMKQRAKDAEWREPEIVWREATDREKYADAQSRQQFATGALRSANSPLPPETP